jgi:hypothetical protein
VSSWQADSNRLNLAVRSPAAQETPIMRAPRIRTPCSAWGVDGLHDKATDNGRASHEQGGRSWRGIDGGRRVGNAENASASSARDGGKEPRLLGELGFGDPSQPCVEWRSIIGQNLPSSRRSTGTPDLDPVPPAPAQSRSNIEMSGQGSSFQVCANSPELEILPRPLSKHGQDHQIQLPSSTPTRLLPSRIRNPAGRGTSTNKKKQSCHVRREERTASK